MAEKKTTPKKEQKTAPTAEKKTAPKTKTGGTPKISAEDRKRGYRVGKWGEHPNYIALEGPFATLDEEAMKRHVAAQRRIRRT